MLIALNDKSERIRATPGSVAICTECGMELIPKCGNVRIWHWAHKISSDCYYSTHPMTEWHYGWQDFALKQGYNIELKVTDESGKIHRADIVRKRRYVRTSIDQPLVDIGRIIEIQHSNIPLDDLAERQNFYRNKGYGIDWILDLQSKYERGHLHVNKSATLIEIKNIPKIIQCLVDLNCDKIVIDFDNNNSDPTTHCLFNILKINDNVIEGFFINKVFGQNMKEKIGDVNGYYKNL